MKSALFGALLLLSGAAAAQSTMQTQDAHAGHGQTVAPGNTAVERDARGIPVVSAPATAPAGWNQPAGSAAGVAPANQPAASMGAATDLPPCSRTVTDRCVQTYERGARR